MLQLKTIAVTLAIILELTFTGCYLTEKSKGVAYLRPYKSDSLEIELPYLIKGRGSLHNFTFEKFKDSSANWIYISQTHELVPSNKIVLRYTKGYRPQSNLRGDIYIQDSLLTVNFKIPKYSNKGVIKRWTNYRFNGIYNLTALK